MNTFYLNLEQSNKKYIHSSFPQYFRNSVVHFSRMWKDVGMKMDCEKILYITTGMCTAELFHIPVFHNVSAKVFYTFLGYGRRYECRNKTLWENTRYYHMNM